MKTPVRWHERFSGKSLWIALGLGWGCLAAARGQDAPLRELVDQVLDHTKAVHVENLPIREALARVEEQTGLRFTAPDSVIERMPYGAQTRLTIKVEDMPLRRGLTQVLEGLGLDMRVEGDKVRILPGPVLQRLNRRLTVAEVELLSNLSRKPWAMLDRSNLPLRFEIDPQGRPQETFEQTMNQIQAPNALRQLDGTAKTLGWVWLPEGDALVLCPRREFIRDKLDQPLDAAYQRVALDELLVDLGRKIGVTVSFEPGALQHVGARDRVVDLVQRQTSVRQILERIGGNTGLRYDIVEDGVRVAGPAGTGTESSPPRAAGPVVARIGVPIGNGGATLDFLLRAEELPPELQQLREEKLAELIRDLRQMAASRRP